MKTNAIIFFDNNERLELEDTVTPEIFLSEIKACISKKDTMTIRTILGGRKMKTVINCEKIVHASFVEVD